MSCPRLQDVHACSLVGLGIHAQYLSRIFGGSSLWWDEMEPGLQGSFQNTFLHVIRINCVFKHRGIANFS